MKETSNIFFKSKMRNIDARLTTTHEKEMIYRIINFGDVYFFAQEISTGCIFPTYCFTGKDEKNYNDVRFRSYSYLKNGKYFLFYPTTNTDEIFKYCFKEDSIEKNAFEIPSVREINIYLSEKRKDNEWRKTLQAMELKNEYLCDLSLIKEKIAALKICEYRLDLDFNNVKPEYIEYVPSIDLEEIENFGYDLSKQDKLCNLVGREEEKKKIIKALAIRKSSVLLIGEPGSGKTSIPESLALDIKKGTNPWLKNKIIFYLDTAILVSGTNFRGDFEKKFLDFIKFCVENKGRIIIFIDEIHTLYGLGRTADSSIDAMNILKPYISKGDITIIGATTKKEYQEYMANDPAFLRRMEEIRIFAPDKNMNIQIILSYINDLQNKYNIKLDINSEIIYELADFIIDVTDTSHQRVIGINKVVNPTISKNIIEEAFAEALYNERKVVTVDDICYSILSCDKFSPTYRKEVVEKLKKKIIGTFKTGDSQIVEFKPRTLILVK